MGKKKKGIVKKILKGLGIAFAATGVGVLCLGAKLSFEKTNSLPNKIQIQENIDYYDAIDDYLTITDQKSVEVKNVRESVINRKQIKEGETLYFIIPEDFPKEAKDAIKSGAEKFNFYFSQINDAYHFGVIEGGTIFDKMDANNTVISTKKINENFAGYCYGIPVFGQDGQRQVYSKIVFDESYVYDEEKVQYLENLFIHEAVHSLGIGDAYLYQETTQRSIMGHGNLQENYKDLTKNDIKLLASLYQSDCSEETRMRIKDFIEHYEEKYVEWYQQKLLKIQELASSYDSSIAKGYMSIMKEYNVTKSTSKQDKFYEPLCFEIGNRPGCTYKYKNEVEYEDKHFVSKSIVKIIGDRVYVTELRYYTDNPEKTVEIVEKTQECEYVDGTIMFEGNVLVKLDNYIFGYSENSKSAFNFIETKDYENKVKSYYNEMSNMNEQESVQSANSFQQKLLQGAVENFNLEDFRKYIKNNYGADSDLLAKIGDVEQFDVNANLNLKSKERNDSIVRSQFVFIKQGKVDDVGVKTDGKNLSTYDSNYDYSLLENGLVGNKGSKTVCLLKVGEIYVLVGVTYMADSDKYYISPSYQVYEETAFTNESLNAEIESINLNQNLSK